MSIPGVLQSHYQRVKQYKILTKKEEQELFKKLEETGSEEVKQKILNCNWRLVISIASRYKHRNLDLEELMQEGNIGLVKALNKFDYTLGYKFSTYATWWIRQAITTALKDTEHPLGVPSYLVENISKLIKERCNLRKELDRDPTNEELGERLNLTIEQVKDIKNNLKKPKSLNDKVDNSNEEMLNILQDENVKTPEKEFLEKYNKEKIQEVLETLPEREKIIIEERFLNREKTNLEDLGKRFGISRERIRQLESKAIRKLRHPSRIGDLYEIYKG